MKAIHAEISKQRDVYATATGVLPNAILVGVEQAEGLLFALQSTVEHGEMIYMSVDALDDRQYMGMDVVRVFKKDYLRAVGVK